MAFLSTLSLRRATIDNSEISDNLTFLSTLSLRRATALEGVVTLQQYDFYPRSPCGERRGFHKINCQLMVFLSTLSLRRATRRSFPARRYPANFYPRSPCGERRFNRIKDLDSTMISIHALLAESDHSRRCRTSAFRRFLSTLSLRRATPRCPKRALAQSISIHALLAESDVATVGLNLVGQIFLSTLSLRRATA